MFWRVVVSVTDNGDAINRLEAYCNLDKAEWELRAQIKYKHELESMTRECKPACWRDVKHLPAKTSTDGTR